MVIGVNLAKILGGLFESEHQGLGTGYNPVHNQGPSWVGTGHGRGLDWVRCQTLSRLCRVGHDDCRV